MNQEVQVEQLWGIWEKLTKKNKFLLIAAAAELIYRQGPLQSLAVGRELPVVADPKD